MSIKKYMQKIQKTLKNTLQDRNATMEETTESLTPKTALIQPFLPASLKGYSNYNVINRYGYLYICGVKNDKETSYYELTTPIIYGLVKQGKCTIHTQKISLMQYSYVERDIRKAKELKAKGEL